MADVRSVFVNLEDSSSKAGLPLHKALEGEAITSKNAQGALVAKDPSGNFKYLETDANGNLQAIVALDYVEKSASGTNAGNAAYQDIATITLAVDKVYKDFEWIVSCFRDSVFQLVQVDDVTETILVDGIRVGNSLLTSSGELAKLKFTAGPSGTQELVLRGKNLNATSTMDGTIAIKEML
jgi:hypothetical protein